MHDAPTVIVGAGIVGVCCAAFLQRQGRRVVVVDRLPPGEATSFGNAGSLSWRSCVPIAVPGLWAQVPGWLMRRDGPLTIRWRYLPGLMPWLWHFLRAGRLDRLEASSTALAALHGPSLDLYRMLARDAGIAQLVRSTGFIHVYPRSLPDRADRIEWRLTARHGATIDVLTGAELRALEPDISERYVQAVHIRDQGYAADPSRLVKGLARHVAASGGEIVQSEVHGFDLSGDRVRAVRTAGRAIEARDVVIAAGAWSTRLTREVGLDLPLQSERGYHVTLAQPGVTVRHTIMETERKFVATPMEMGLRFAGTVELAGLDAAPDYRRAQAILDGAAAMFPGLRTSPHTRWMGQRPSLPDGLPVIGRSPRHANLFLAFGHAHTGMIGAPNTGRLVAGMVTGTPPNIDPAPYRPERFHSAAPTPG